MSNITGTVVSVSLNTTVEKQDKTGTYPAWELVFKDDSGKIGSVQKHVNGLKYTKGLKAALESLQPGDRFTLIQEKGANGFNEVQSIVKGDHAQMPDVSSNKPRTGVVTGSNYETPVEREWNRIRIIRQSCINYAINLLKTEKHTPEVDEVLTLATKLTEFVNQKEVE